MMENEFVEFLTNVGSVIAEMFGSNCEVVINDLDNEEHAVIAIFNGHVSGRKVGSPLIKDAKERISNCADGYFINYRKPLGKKKYIKASTIEVKFNERRFALCINYDCSELQSFALKLMNFLALAPTNVELTDFSNDKIVVDALYEAIIQIGRPIHLLNKNDRMKIIETLYKKGILKLQKSIPQIASCLGVSRYTIYNYLKELNLDLD